MKRLIILRLLALLSALLAVLPPLPSQSKPFTFAWLSDTHIGGSTGSDDLRATVADINTLDSVAFVVISGDITEMGWNAEFDTTRAILQTLNVPYHLVPGNHDTKWTESGCAQFSRVFGADRFVFEHEGFTFAGLHQGPIMRMGDGHFAPEDIRWFDSVATSIGTSAPLFLVTHYPLDPSIDNYERLTSRLLRMNVQAVLVGHGHANRVMSFDGLPALMGRSNLRARRGSAGYNLVHVREDSVLFFERESGGRTLPVRHTLPIGQRTYSDAVPVRPPESARWMSFASGVPVWQVETGWTNTAAPVVQGDAVYVANRQGAVVRLRLSDGSRVWQTMLSDGVLGNPAYAEGKLVVPAIDGYVSCLQSSDGTVLWKVKTGPANVASPTIIDGVVYVGSSDGRFRALQLSDGTERWSYAGVGAFVETRALVTETSVIFGAWDSYLYCLDRRTGTLRWKWNNGSPSRLLSPAAVWPVVSGDNVFIVAPDRQATVLDLQTGSQVWRSARHQVRESAGVSEDGSLFFAKLMNDSVIAYDATAREEREVWMKDCGFGYDIDPSMPVERNGKLFFGTKNGLIYCLWSKNGEIEWVYKLGNTIVNTVAPASDGDVVVTNADGTVARIGSPSKRKDDQR